MKTYASTIIAIICIVFGSCNGGNNATSPIEADTVIVVEADSIAVEPEVVKIVGDTAELKTLKTAEEVISWMYATSDSVAYAEGILPQMAQDSLPYTKRLLKNTYKYFIVVDKPSMFVVLYDKVNRRRNKL